jgi:hypothetical protein
MAWGRVVAHPAACQRHRRALSSPVLSQWAIPPSPALSSPCLTRSNPPSHASAGHRRHPSPRSPVLWGAMTRPCGRRSTPVGCSALVSPRRWSPATRSHAPQKCWPCSTKRGCTVHGPRPRCRGPVPVVTAVRWWNVLSPVCGHAVLARFAPKVRRAPWCSGGGRSWPITPLPWCAFVSSGGRNAHKRSADCLV